MGTKHKLLRVLLLSLYVLVFLMGSLMPVFAQSLSQYSKSESIACGNAVCEIISINLNAGEEKSVMLGPKTHTIKFINIERVETPYPRYYMYFSVDGSPRVDADDVKFKELLGITSNMQLYTFFESDLTKIMLTFREEEVCAVPDCAFPVEFNVYKKWNLVPLYLVFSTASPKSTCKLEDFKVVYAYNPLQNSFVKLYSFGDTKTNFETAISNLQRSFDSERVLAGTPFNSVWVYSNKECKISATLPKIFENFLLVLKQLTERTIQRPFLPGESPPPPEKIITTFASGWNFFIGSKDMQGKSLDEIKGNCNIEKAYTFDASSQSWKQLTTGVGPADNFIFKVTSKCMFGFPEIAPPEVPT